MIGESYIDDTRFHYYNDTFDENEELLTGEITPLHVSKYTTELYARAFSESYGLPTCVFRLTGIYGPRQFGGEDHGWVANFAVRTVMNWPLKIFGTDLQVRDILYVKDAAQAFDDWFSNCRKHGVYNVGGEMPCVVSIKTCLQKLRVITQQGQNITREPARKGDLWYFVCNSTKAHEEFKWHAKVLPDEGLKNLVDWIRANKEMFS
jgi:CDP-paratose 2-epimerase